MAIPPLCDVASVAATTGLSATDARVVAAVTRASSSFRGETFRRITRSTQTITRNGPGGVMLHLPDAPIIAIASVTLDGVVVTDYDLDAEAARLERSVRWGERLGSIVVVYTHGYDPDLAKGEDEGGIPEQIRGAVAERAEMIVNTRAGIQTYTTGGESITGRVGASRDWLAAVEQFTLTSARV